MDKFVFPSYAKLNLYLEVLNKRKDNYHNLKTVFERIDLADEIIFTLRADKTIKVSSNSSRVPKDNTNLAYRAAKLLQDTFRVRQGAEIRILKRIPVASGMGGGSGNAATTLLALNKLWKLGLKQRRLVKLAKKLGSDVPFFVYNCPFATGEQRGDKISPLRTLKNRRLWHILLVPKIHVSTPKVYAAWDEFCAKISCFTGLTIPEYNVKLLILALQKNNLASIQKAVYNSLEEVTSRLYPELVQLKARLKDLGLKSILMSGSGPALFGIVSSRKEALALKAQLEKNIKSVEIFVTKTR